jgi:hypothetical protein
VLARGVPWILNFSPPGQRQVAAFHRFPDPDGWASPFSAPPHLSDNRQVCFYWVVDTSRRRAVNLTLGTCTLTGGVGSEFVQSMVTVRSHYARHFATCLSTDYCVQNREFDPLDIVSNLLGSGLGLLLCAWYHRRMLERRRLAKSYQPVATANDVEFDQEAEELHDIEAARSPSPTVSGVEGV